jgi:hypothetical protein
VKDLVVFYSRTGKTEMAARAIAEKLGADIRRLVEKRGRRGPLGFLRSGYEASKGVESELVSPDYSLKVYERVVLCQPFWASAVVPAMNTFLARIDPQGKRFALVIVKGGAPAAVVLAKMTQLLESRGGKVISTIEVQAGMGRRPTLEKVMVTEVERWAAALPR